MPREVTLRKATFKLAVILVVIPFFLSNARMLALLKSLHSLVFLCFTWSAFGETLIDGLRAYGGGRYAGTAVVWGRLAQIGNMDVQTTLAGLYSSAPPSIAFFPAKAASLYWQANEQGDRIAQINLSDFYGKGAGVSTDLAKAAFWLELTAYKDYDWVAERLCQLEPKLTKVDRAVVERLTIEWRTLHPR